MYKLIIINIVLLLTFSCVQEVDIPIEWDEERIVVHSIIQSDSIVDVFVAKTQAVQNNSTAWINNARIQLWESDNLINAQFNYLDSGHYRCVNYRAVPDKDYLLQVKVDGLPAVEATEILPSKANVKNAEFTYGIISSDNGLNIQTQGTGSILIRDNQPDIKNYYEIRIFTVFKDETFLGATNVKLLDYLNPIMLAEGITEMPETSTQPPLFFSDQTFDGGVANFSFDFSFNGGIIVYSYGSIDYLVDLYADVRTVSENYYNYMKSREQYLSNIESMELQSVDQLTEYTLSSEPVRLWTNLNDGYGVFIGYTSHIVKLVNQDN